MRKILAKILFCPEEYLDNVLMHIPIGAVIVVAAMLSGWLAACFTYIFVKYETIERREIKDKCFPDLQGSMWGMGITIAAVILWRLTNGF